MNAHSRPISARYALLGVVAVWFAPGAILLADEVPERVTLRGHEEWVGCVCFSPDGKILATAGRDRTIRLWDVARGSHIATLTGHADCIWSVAFSPDGKRLVSAADGGILKLWEVGSAKCAATLDGTRYCWRLKSVSFGPDGKKVFFPSERALAEWDLATGKARLLSNTKHEYGKHLGLVYSAVGKKHTVWDVVAHKKMGILQGNLSGFSCVTFSSDGSLVATGSGSNEVAIWDSSTGRRKVRAMFPGINEFTCLTFSPDGRALAVGYSPRRPLGKDGHISLLETASGKEIATFKRHTPNRPPNNGALFAIAFSPDGKTLATASCDRTIKLFDMPALKAKGK